MSIPSSPRSAVLVWCQQHTEIWTDEAANIGLSALQASDFKANTSAYAAAVDAVEAAKLALKTAVQNANDLYTPMRRSMTQNITTIRNFADVSNDPNVLVLAAVPPRKDPSQMPPPGQPTDLSVELLSPSGAVQLRWKSQNPPGSQGTSYIIRRRIADTGDFTFVGVTGERRFVDNTFIAGPDSVQYTVQGQRADAAGPESQIFTVRFGRNGPGVTIQSATTSGAKLAA
jgi:hypothetical protein